MGNTSSIIGARLSSWRGHHPRGSGASLAVARQSFPMPFLSRLAALMLMQSATWVFHRPHHAVRKQINVPAAAATPNGSFRSCGLSSEMSGFGRSPRRAKPRRSATMFRIVALIRPEVTMRATAIAPETRMLVSRTKVSIAGPSSAPMAPINFQSPAPSARNSTNGSSRASASPIPSADVVAPRHPSVQMCRAIPKTMPDTVNQFGSRRVRQSTQAAANVNASADTQTVCCAFIGFVSVCLRSRPRRRPANFKNSVREFTANLRARRQPVTGRQKVGALRSGQRPLPLLHVKNWYDDAVSAREYVGGSLRERVADAIGKALHRADRNQTDGRNEQCVFGQILTFCFKPQSLQKVLHVSPLRDLVSAARTRCHLCLCGIQRHVKDQC